MLSLNIQIWWLLQARSFLAFRQTVECEFTLKLVHDMITTYSQCSDYFQLISQKKAERMKEYEIKKGLLTTKLKEQGKRKKCTTKSMKETKDQLETVVNKIKNPFSLEKGVYLCSEILPDIANVLNFMSIWPGSGAVVERGFSLMNMIMNDLRSSMNIRTLDPMIIFTIMVLIYLMKRLLKLLMLEEKGKRKN